MAKRGRSSSPKKARKQSKNDAHDEVLHLEGVEEGKKPQSNLLKPPSKKRRSIKKMANGGRLIFLRKKAKFTVSLLPGSLRNCEAFVEDSIRGLLMKYVEGLGGILMGFENVNLISDKQSQGRGWILNELPHIHYVASCDALVFCPFVGCELQGIVNECRPSHLGVLALNYFNVMISGEQLHAAGYSFDPELQNWTAGTESISTKDKINFKIEKIHECDGTVSLEGVNPSLSLLVEA